MANETARSTYYYYGWLKLSLRTNYLLASLLGPSLG
jgi:hypothetical protein